MLIIVVDAMVVAVISLVIWKWMSGRKYHGRELLPTADYDDEEELVS